MMISNGDYLPMTAPRQRRWFSFSLRTMFVVVMVLALPLGWLGWQIQIVRERKAVLAEIASGKATLARTLAEHDKTSLPGQGHPDADQIQVSAIRQWLGDEPVIGIILFSDTDLLIHRTEYAFPEAQIYVYNADDRPPPPRSAREVAFRDSLAPLGKGSINVRQPNRGTIFKTGLIEK